jgi:hypothetical protein
LINENKISIVLPSERYQGAPEIDSYVDVSLDSKIKEVVEYDRNYNLFLNEVFDTERQKSTNFNISGKFSTIFLNSYTGKTNYTPFKNNLYYVNESYYQQQSFLPNFDGYWGGYPQYKEFDLTRNDHSITGYTSPPLPHLTLFQRDSDNYNWNFYISYPHSNDYTKTLSNFNGFYAQWVASEGIPFKTYFTNYNGENLIMFECFVEHGLSVGENVQLSLSYTNPANNTEINLFEVYSLGNETVNSEKYYFAIQNIGYLNGFLSEGTIGKFKRVIDPNNLNETTSKYYVRKHIILQDKTNLVLTNAGFEKEIFSDDSKFFQAAFTSNNTSKIANKNGTNVYNLTTQTSINIDGLVDNQNRPLTELYFTIINKGKFGWFNEPVYQGNTSLKQGWEFNIDYPDPSPYWRRNPNNSNSDTQITTIEYQKTENNQTYTFYYNSDLNIGDTIDGSFCEWNDYEQKEREISEIYHKFVLNRNIFLDDNATTLTTNNPKGYYYKPHHNFTLRVFSDYIETASIFENVEDIPNYAYFSVTNQQYRWRDLYPYGFIDSNGIGVDKPYTNNIHYYHNNFIFKILPEGSNIANNNINYINTPIVDDCE